MKMKLTDLMERYLPLRHAYQAVPGFVLTTTYLRIFQNAPCYRYASIGVLILAIIWSIVIYVKRPGEGKRVTAWMPVGMMLSGILFGLMGLIRIDIFLYMIILSGVLIWLTVRFRQVQEAEE